MKCCLLIVSLCLLTFALHAQEQFITLGSGGGFTGSATVYKINSRGQVWKGKGLGEITFTECARVKAKKARKYIADASVQLMANSSLNYPGNLYYYIALSDKQKETRATWGDAQHPVPDALKNLYTEIQTVVGALKYKPVK